MKKQFIMLALGVFVLAATPVLAMLSEEELKARHNIIKQMQKEEKEARIARGYVRVKKVPIASVTVDLNGQGLFDAGGLLGLKIKLLDGSCDDGPTECMSFTNNPTTRRQFDRDLGDINDWEYHHESWASGHALCIFTQKLAGNFPIHRFELKKDRTYNVTLKNCVPSLNDNEGVFDILVEDAETKEAVSPAKR